ncbi:flavodoxin-dependent (E)-4-hydroxy-3-methylbut-2-enyl-diphosphate synthase [Candidatus Peregrinibacteria bacterium]|nr:flavodoxin-dependent (E)-4-hydroxy-3-methylbut-2-enyl-diphosphate synthase [Candidatus Peregrinibacteria bacterium]MBI4234866.1 flavodoxin-dependent (E)-4-hydroxy-3-methylbut-2-enyl-diphosphate synthase [Candidatus Peregrinibacteria bacterium]
MRFITPVVTIRDVKLGGNFPIVIQSMTNTDTVDAKKTAAQCMELADAGSEIVRVTVNDESAAKAISELRKRLDDAGYEKLPIVGDFHFNGHLLLGKYSKCASTLDKYRVNPGNVGYGDKHDYNIVTMIKIAVKYNKPVRIGVNWGSLDRELLTDMMNANARREAPKSYKEVLIDAMVESALRSARLAEENGLARDKIVLSVKMSMVNDVVQAYELLAKRMKKGTSGKLVSSRNMQSKGYFSETPQHPYAIHLGLTEAGSALKGAIASTAALSILLRQGIGDTIRISLTPGHGHPRTEEVEVCKMLLQSLDLRYFRPTVTSCPGCGRTDNDLFQKLAIKINEHVEQKMFEWVKKYPRVRQMTIAVMGCVVNGPGESMHADIGISLPGKGEQPVAQVFQKGKYFTTLKGNKITDQFIQLLERYIRTHF